MSNPPRVNGTQMRALAEALNATRGVELHLVRRPDEPKLLVVETMQTGDEEILSCMTPSDVPGRPEVKTLTGDVQKGTDPPIHIDFFKDEMKFDALFFSESAVEKFVLPYYTRIMTKEELQALFGKFNDQSVFALGHLPKSIPTEINGIVGSDETSREPLYVLAPRPGIGGDPVFQPLSKFVLAIE